MTVTTNLDNISRLFSMVWGESFCWYWQNCWSSPIKLMLPSVVLMLAILLHVYYFVQIAYFFSVTIIIHWYQWIYIEPNPISKTKSIIFIYIEVVSVLIFNLKNKIFVVIMIRTRIHFTHCWNAYHEIPLRPVVIHAKSFKSTNQNYTRESISELQVYLLNTCRYCAKLNRLTTREIYVQLMRNEV
jgi:hypothetical protein